MSSTIGLPLCKPARLSQKKLNPLFIIFSLLLSSNTFASNGVDNLGRADYDLDNDGLIEINDLADLNEIRNNLDGKTLYTSNIGCPNAEDGSANGGCIGFELAHSLNFDTNANGQMDSGDAYWNEDANGVSEGWLPLGNNSVPFSATFNGNGYTINNLVINRPTTNHVGLFGSIKNATIENVSIAGLYSSIVGGEYVGTLIGSASEGSQIRNILIAAKVSGDSRVGGLVGSVSAFTTYIHINNSVISGSVVGNAYVGGVVGFAYFLDTQSIYSINGVLSTALVEGDRDRDRSVGGLIGYNDNLTVIDSYWAQDSSQQLSSAGQSEVNSYVGLSLETLQCAIAADSDFSAGCVSSDGSAENLTATMVLYRDWDAEIWDFGSSEQLPGLKFNGQVLRDSDGDGVVDTEDALPNHRAAWQDIDGDGHPDVWSLNCNNACIAGSGLILDQFPDHAWAYLDADFDGLVDGINNCSSDCEFDGLTKDGALGDFDNDGILDSDDNDSNNDGIENVDADQDGLIEIASLDELNAMRFQLEGVGLQLTADTELDVSGCPFVIHQGTYQQRCFGYELTQNLDFDSNQNGQSDSEDAYWNEGSDGISAGWLPVGNHSGPFAATFNGNGYTINNLVINRPETTLIGLFGYIQEAVVENVALAGSHSSITGNDYVGALIGYASGGNQIRNILVAAKVSGNLRIGGLVGSIDISGARSKMQIDNAVISGSISGSVAVGGLAGFLGASSDSDVFSVSAVLNTAFVEGALYVGGLVGRNNTDILVTNSYWAQDSSQQTNSGGQSEANSYVGLNLETLQCAVAANSDFSAGCVSDDGSAEGLNAAVVLYSGWDADVWDFGTHEQLPGLKFNEQVLRDSDGDGVFDEADSFISNPAASIDSDQDGQPDMWNAGCFSACQAASGLILDSLLNDTDNDGATNDVDSDFEHDNGKPILLTVAPTIHTPVNTADGSSFTASAESVSEQFSALSAIDAVDSALSFKAYLNSIELVADDDGQITLASGLQVINWVAVDQAGNESEPLEQHIYVYPQVRFKAANSIIGEGSNAEIIIELSGDSPVYPVPIEVLVDAAASSIDQADVDVGDGPIYTFTIEVGDDAESFNRQVSLWVPILEDNQSENDELLVIELNAVTGVSEDYDTFFIDEGNKTHRLTVTEQNLAPTVQLLIEQGGTEVSHVIQNGGDVSITVIINDGNGRDEHSLMWDLDALGLNAPQGRVLQFSPEDLAAGDYTIAVSVTDNGINPLSGNATADLLLVAPVIGD